MARQRKALSLASISGVPAVVNGEAGLPSNG
jgi:hypothetical protein